MAKNTDARNALRSFLPERRLISSGDHSALAYKYEAWSCEDGEDGEPSERLLALADPNCWRATVPPKVRTGRKMIDFKGVSLEIGAPSIISGQDADNGVSIDYDSHDASMLHVDRIEGPKHLRRQLGNVAAYAMLHKKVLETPYIVGVTYAEMARVGVALGMRPLDITSIDGYYEADVRATHAISFAGSQRLREFESAAVYLPTAEFVDRYYV